MKAGDLYSIDVELPRTEGRMTFRVFDKDPMLDTLGFQRDVLLEFFLEPGTEFISAPLVIASDAQGCVYALIFSATDLSSEEELVEKAHNVGLRRDEETGLLVPPEASLEIYTACKQTLELGDSLGRSALVLSNYIENLAGPDLSGAEYYSTICIDQVPEEAGQAPDGGPALTSALPMRTIINSRTHRGVETYSVSEGKFDFTGVCERFKDPHWSHAKYYETIRTAVVGETLYLLGRAAAGMVIYRWEGNGWSIEFVASTVFGNSVGKSPRCYGSITVATMANGLIVAGLNPSAELSA